MFGNSRVYCLSVECWLFFLFPFVWMAESSLKRQFFRHSDVVAHIKGIFLLELWQVAYPTWHYSCVVMMAHTFTLSSSNVAVRNYPLMALIHRSSSAVAHSANGMHCVGRLGESQARMLTIGHRCSLQRVHWAQKHIAALNTSSFHVRGDGLKEGNKQRSVTFRRRLTFEYIVLGCGSEFQWPFSNSSKSANSRLPPSTHLKASPPTHTFAQFIPVHFPWSQLITHTQFNVKYPIHYSVCGAYSALLNFAHPRNFVTMPSNANIAMPKLQ